MDWHFGENGGGLALEWVGCVYGRIPADNMSCVVNDVQDRVVRKDILVPCDKQRSPCNYRPCTLVLYFLGVEMDFKFCILLVFNLAELFLALGVYSTNNANNGALSPNRKSFLNYY